MRHPDGGLHAADGTGTIERDDGPLRLTRAKTSQKSSQNPGERAFDELWPAANLDGMARRELRRSGGKLTATQSHAAGTPGREATSERAS